MGNRISDLLPLKIHRQDHSDSILRISMDVGRLIQLNTLLETHNHFLDSFRSLAISMYDNERSVVHEPDKHGYFLSVLHNIMQFNTVPVIAHTTQ